MWPATFCAESPHSSTSSSVSEKTQRVGWDGPVRPISTIRPGKAGERNVTMFSLIAASLSVGAVKVSTPTLIWAGAEIAKAIYRASQED